MRKYKVLSIVRKIADIGIAVFFGLSTVVMVITQEVFGYLAMIPFFVLVALGVFCVTIHAKITSIFKKQNIETL